MQTPGLSNAECACLFSVLPNCDSSAVKKLQADDVSLAYEQVPRVSNQHTPHDLPTFTDLYTCYVFRFSKKFPGYTAENLSEKGVHEVAQRRFVLVAAVRRNVLNTPILQTIKNGTLTNLLCFFVLRTTPSFRLSPKMPSTGTEINSGPTLTPHVSV